LRYGIVATKGERAHGFWEAVQVRSCESVGSMYFINFKAAPVPQGNFKGRSKMLPNRMSSEERGDRKRPWTCMLHVTPLRSSLPKYSAASGVVLDGSASLKPLMKTITSPSQASVTIRCEVFVFTNDVMGVRVFGVGPARTRSVGIVFRRGGYGLDGRGRSSKKKGINGVDRLH